MKKLFFLLTTISLLFTAACGKDDDCEAGSLESTIVGEWNVTILGITGGVVEFKSDGTLVDEDESIINNEIGGEPVTSKNYTVNSNSSITVSATNANGTQSTDLDVTSYECDEIRVDVLGFDTVLKRK